MSPDEEVRPSGYIVLVFQASREGSGERAGVDHRLLLLPDAGHDERVVPPVEQPSFDFLHQQLGGVEPGAADRRRDRR